MKCPQGIYDSVDGATRCKLCRLTPDLCTCDPNCASRLIIEACLPGILASGGSR